MNGQRRRVECRYLYPMGRTLAQMGELDEQVPSGSLSGSHMLSRWCTNGITEATRVSRTSYSDVHSDAIRLVDKPNLYRQSMR